MNEIEKIILDEKFHAVSFLYKGKFYGFAGWWILYWGEVWKEENTKDYDSKEEFLKDKPFDGRSLAEAYAVGDITDVDPEYEP